MHVLTAPTLSRKQSKWDFDGMAPYLFGALLVFFVSGPSLPLGEDERKQ